MTRIWTPIERAMVYPAIGTVVGCWLGVIPIALDWDRPWQVRIVIYDTRSTKVDDCLNITGVATDTGVLLYFGLRNCFYVSVNYERYEVPG